MAWLALFVSLRLKSIFGVKRQKITDVARSAKKNNLPLNLPYMKGKFRLTFDIKLVSFKKIDICITYEPKSIIFGAYAQIWAYIILLITRF